MKHSRSIVRASGIEASEHRTGSYGSDEGRRLRAAPVRHRRIHVMLQRRGIDMSLKKLRRLYGEERLQVRRRGGRKRALGTRRPMLVPDRCNQRWSLDFVSDSFTDGRRFRVLTVVDDRARECLALVVDTSLSGRRVVRELDAIIDRRGRPLRWSATTAPSSPAWRTCAGPRIGRSTGTTSRLASQCRTVSSRASTSASVMSA